jgi:imidazole glycerol-phosphate synthase subunit HisF
MKKIRLIPVILLKNGRVVQSKGFRRHQVLGNPSTIVWRLSNWFSDELVYLDISREKGYDLRRDDLNYANRANMVEIIEDVAQKCFMPLTVGGGIRELDAVYQRLEAGADKVAINTQAFRRPDFISECAGNFGSQCIVASIDAKQTESGGWEVHVDCGREPTGLDPREWAKELQSRGAGEILLNSIDSDGQGDGYDLGLIMHVCDAVSIPVIALGGVGEWAHLAEAIDRCGPSAVAAANIFQYTENSVYRANQYLYSKGYPVRKPLVKTVIVERGV